MALMNPANYQDYIKSLNIKLPNTPSQPATSTAPTPDTSALRAAYDSRNAANSTVNPSTGYGGADYSKADSATQQGIQDNESKLASDPNFVQSEIARTKGVLSTLGTNADTTAQTNYLNRLMGMVQKPETVTTAQPVQPIQAAQTTQTPDNTSTINDIYNDNYAAQSQKLKAARDQSLAGLAGQDDLIKQNAISGLNNNDLMANQRMQALKEAMANAGLSASGDNVSAQVGIGTSQQQGANDINTNRGNLLNQSMAQRNAINNNSSADDLALMQQLQAARGGQLLDDSYKNRQYGLDLAGLSGQLPGGGQTLAALNADRNYQLGLSGLSGQLPPGAGGGQTLAALQQAFQQRQGNIGNALSLSQLMGQLYQPKSSGDALFNQTPLGSTLGGQQQQLQNTQVMGQLTGYIPDGKGGMTATTAEQQRNLTNLWTAADQTGTISDQLAQMYGLPKGTPTRAASEFAKQLAISQQNADTSRKNADNSTNNANQAALYKQWEATGKAPAGIPGVTEGTPLYDKTGVRQDEALKNKQGQLDAKAFESERDSMVSAVRTNKVNVNDAMTQINQDEQLGVYTPDLAEKLRSALRVLAGSTKITTDPQNNVQVDLSGFGGGNGSGSTVTGNVFGK